MSFTLKSSQTIAVVAVAAALVAGAYAVGRSSQQSSAAPEMAELGPPAAATKPVQAEAPKPVSKPAPKPAATTAAAETKASTRPLCADCARVVSVRSEERQGEGSGLGAIGGAVIGGLLGNQVGGGSGKKIATVGGAVAGGYAGNEIEKRHKSYRVWIVRLAEPDGSSRNHVQRQDPQVQAGDVVVLRDGLLQPQRPS
jgi:outer membrane lipoprotein SlyB